jgi:hypothetical protein
MRIEDLAELTIPGEVACAELLHMVKIITSLNLSNSVRVSSVFRHLVQTFSEHGCAVEEKQAFEQLELFNADDIRQTATG